MYFAQRMLKCCKCEFFFCSYIIPVVNKLEKKLKENVAKKNR